MHIFSSIYKIVDIFYKQYRLYIEIHDVLRFDVYLFVLPIKKQALLAS